MSKSFYDLVCLAIDGNPCVILDTLPSKPLIGRQLIWLRIRACAGVKSAFVHNLCYTFPSTAFAPGQGLPMVGKLIGHTQV